MKIVVDTIPEKAGDCILSEYDCGCMRCKLTKGAICALECNQKCERLLPMNEMEFKKNQMKYGK